MPKRGKWVDFAMRGKWVSFVLKNLSFELGHEGWGVEIGKDDMYHRQREQHKKRQGNMRQGEGLLKDILEKVEFMNKNRGKLNACFH